MSGSLSYASHRVFVFEDLRRDVLFKHSKSASKLYRTSFS